SVAADNGAGIYNSGVLTLNRCTLATNSAGANGGGIYNDLPAAGASAVYALNSTFSGNTASNSVGGAIYNANFLAITNCTISGNRAGVAGGGLYCSPQLQAIRNTIVAGNVASEGPDVVGDVQSYGYNLLGA